MGFDPAPMHTKTSARHSGFHEAGHYIAATRSKYPGIFHYVTIEPRERTAGCCGLQPSADEQPTLYQEAMYALGGYASEAYGRACDIIQAEDLRERRDLFNACKDAFREFLKDAKDDSDLRFLLAHKDFTEAYLDQAIEEVFALLDEHWSRVAILGEALEELTTLREGDPEIILAGKDQEPLYQVYLRVRQPIDPPESWLIGASDYFRPGDYNETIMEFTRRFPKRADESVDEWLLRLKLTDEELQILGATR